MNAAERELLMSAVADALAGAGDRSIPAVDTAVAELGWLDMLRDEPSDAIAVVFTALGAAGLTGTVLDDVIVAALGVEPRPDLCFALPPFGSSEPPGAAGLSSARVAGAAELLAVQRNGSRLVARTVPTAAVDTTAVHGVDPAAGLHQVRIVGDGGTSTPLDDGAWESAVALGQRALAHQIAGACRAMLDLACTHAVARVQFGRPIARFQAVRHRLAEAYVTVEALDAGLTAAADAPGPLTAALAKASAGRTARTVAAHCQQVLGGIGFTTEHPFHRSLKRTLVLDGLLGSTDAVIQEVGHQLLAARHVPTLVEL